MQSTPNTNETLQELLKRQNEMQYAAMAHQLSGQALPENHANEYAAIERRIRQLTISARMNELQFAAMAIEQAGQPMPEDLAREYAELEQEMKHLTAD